MVLGVCAIQLSNPFAATSRIDLFGRTLARHHQSQLVGTPRCLALLAPHVIRRSHWPTTVVYDVPVTSKTALLGGRFTLIMSNKPKCNVNCFSIYRKNHFYPSIRFSPDFSRFFPILQTFLGDFTPDGLDSRSLQSLWEWENRVLLEEYYIFDVVIPLEVE